jgi:hypothetical protein
MAYAAPSAADLKLRYSAFAAVDDAVIGYWIADAQRYVTDAWTEADYPIGLMALAAHNMALAGHGAQAATLADVPAGVSRLRSGSLDVSFTDAAANARAAGSLDSTRYGMEYKALLLANRGGPLVAPTGITPDGIYPSWP